MTAGARERLPQALQDDQAVPRRARLDRRRRARLLGGRAHAHRPAQVDEGLDARALALCRLQHGVSRPRPQLLAASLTARLGLSDRAIFVFRLDCVEEMYDWD